MTADWPRTNRWVPWLIAGFLVVAWFLPIDSITPRGFSAFDLKLDRVVLLLMGLVWLPSAILGFAGGPRLRGLGGMALALAVFVLVALFGVIIDVQALLRSGQTDAAFKKLLLLGSYAAFFVIVATSLRPGEVRRFALLFMWLGFGSGLVVLYDRFFEVNQFFALAELLFPGGAFEIRPIGTSPFDPHPVTGPSRHALAAAAMLAMALPYAVVELMDGSQRKRLIHAGVMVVLLLAVWATNRKTGLFASAGALATLLVMRPRDMVLKVLPAGLLLLTVLALLKPQALGFQLERLAPGTITDGLSSQGRSADYPAIVPDIRAHLLTGRGWGTYEYRILDNNWLGLLLETGVLGTAAFAALVASVWTGARRVVGELGLPLGSPALAAAAGTTAFAVSMALFDALSFAQVPYFFLFSAALVAASLRTLRMPELAPAAGHPPAGVRTAGGPQRATGRPLPRL